MDTATGLITDVLVDLNSLKKNGSESVEPISVNDVSQLTYRLLVTGNLQKAQTLLRMPGSPQIKTCPLHQTYLSDPGKNYAFALAGGAIINGTRIAGVSIPNGRSTLTPPSVPKVATTPLATFLNSPGVIINRVPVSRRELIRYMATKLGNPEFNFLLDESYSGRLQLLLDSEGSRHRLNDTPLAHFELLSIGQAIINSPDVNRLARRIEKFINRTNISTAELTRE